MFNKSKNRDIDSEFDFIVSRLNMLICDKYSVPRYMNSGDEVFERIFSVKNVISKLNDSHTKRETMRIFNKLGFDRLFELLRDDKCSHFISECIMAANELRHTKNEISKMKDNDKDVGKKLTKKHDWLKAVYKKGIRFLLEQITDMDTKGYKEHYTALSSLMKDKKGRRKGDNYSFFESYQNDELFDDYYDNDYSEPTSRFNSFLNEDDDYDNDYRGGFMNNYKSGGDAYDRYLKERGVKKRQISDHENKSIANTTNVKLDKMARLLDKMLEIQEKNLKVQRKPKRSYDSIGEDDEDDEEKWEKPRIKKEPRIANDDKTFNLLKKYINANEKNMDNMQKQLKKTTDAVVKLIIEDVKNSNNDKDDIIELEEDEEFVDKDDLFNTDESEEEGKNIVTIPSEEELAEFTKKLENAYSFEKLTPEEIDMLEKGEISEEEFRREKVMELSIEQKIFLYNKMEASGK